MPSPDLPRPGLRTNVVGVTGSGKTTTAGRLAEILDIPHVELDALHWGPGWVGADKDVFRARVAAALAGEAWVVDGNYRAVRAVVWPRVDTVVWLDYPLPVILAQLFRRSVRRIRTQEVLWGTNRESWRTQFASRDSLFVWAIQTHRRRKREIPEVLARPEHARIAVIHHRSPAATRAWLDRLAADP